jgi:transcription-repair coupling factor (superfamily II helicase)
VNLSGLLPLIQECPAYQELADALARQAPATDGLGVIAAARPYLTAALYRQLKRPMVLLTARAERVMQWTDQLRVWTDSGAIYAFPEPDALPYERVPWARETVCDRLTALTALLTWKESDGTEPPVVVASARALMHKTLPVREFRAGLREYRQGQAFDLKRALDAWVAHGYRPEVVVEEPGTFSRRGGLIDVFPPNLQEPVRLELFGDEIDSLRLFDPISQRSRDRIEQFVMAPATEALPRLAPSAAQRAAEADLSLCHPPAKMEYQQDLVALEQGSYFRGIEFYLPYFYSYPATLIDYLPGNGLCLVDDWGALLSTVIDLERQAEALRADLVKAGELPTSLPAIAVPYLTWDSLREVFNSRRPLVLAGEGIQKHPGDTTAGDTIARGNQIAQVFVYEERYGGQLKRVLDGCQEMRAAGQRVVLVSRQAQRIGELLAERKITAVPVEDVIQPVAPRSLTLVQGTLAEGWMLQGTGSSEPGSDGSEASRLRSIPPVPTVASGTAGSGPQGAGGRAILHLLTDAEVFGWARPAPRRASRPAPVTPEAYFADVQPGAYVVHVEYGIGLFQGLVKMSLAGGEREYLMVEYAAGDKLYVPVYQADRLSRYVGAGEQMPHVNRLGTAEWEQVKAKAQKAVEEIADELLELYTAREVVDGHAFGDDTPWQAELEASFPYMETEAQLRALDEIKTDMEQTRPMDRLVIGDVGYGKTEVALRAAFKAVMDGKQVAILVPTTVLAQQHYQTFAERLKPFPVTVAMLSRFLSSKEQEQVVDSLAKGGVDIVIGTHRLLSEDVTFKDLGLLVIDEEQRFGVAHKERLKEMRQEVDVLTLTATPIPRTLHMSLTGVRDMSTIDTPPEERLPVRTHVGDYDETLIRQAILRELDRGGQVFFVHNRVLTIYGVAQQLHRLVPEVRIAVGHGQMAERELEKVMLEFAAGNVDVLVCTSIIESGLDIPNANTLIVHQAERFGLSQLYQLKGRVGRGARRAYAYFLHSKYTSIGDTARQRLETIGEATELGAGFRIAMRDLEIRGAGELLGRRQHGHIAAIGFDLYTRLLAQAVHQARIEGRAARGPSPQDEEEAAAYVQPLQPSVQINLPLDAHLPEDYVPDETLRLQLYRRLAGLTVKKGIDDMQAELEDRFGPLPVEAENLFYQLRLKIDALAAGVKAITPEEGQIIIRADSLEKVDRDALQRRLGDRARVARRAVWVPLDEMGQGEAANREASRYAIPTEGRDHPEAERSGPQGADGRWRTVLAAVLQAMIEGLQ